MKQSFHILALLHYMQIVVRFMLGEVNFQLYVEINKTDVFF